MDCCKRKYKKCSLLASKFFISARARSQKNRSACMLANVRHPYYMLVNIISWHDFLSRSLFTQNSRRAVFKRCFATIKSIVNFFTGRVNKSMFL